MTLVSSARKRRQQLKQEKKIQQLMVPCLEEVPVKRRRSSAASAEASDGTIEEQRQTVEEQQHLLDGAPQTELFLVTIKTRDELNKSTDAAIEVEALDKLLLQRDEQKETTLGMEVAWGHEFAALDSLRRLIKYHQDQAKRQIENDAVNKLVLPAASSLRSAMARNALLCLQELILGLKTETVAHFDAIVPVLLTRACSEKQFLKDLAREVLDTAVQAGAEEELLKSLLATSATEKNAQIVSVAGLYVTKCITRMDRELLRAFVVEKRSSFFDEVIVLLNCKFVECKTAIRRSCQHTRRVVGNQEFLALAKEKLSGTALSDILKASEMREAAKPGHAKPSIRERMLQLKKQQKKVRSGGNGISVVVVAPPLPRSRSSSTQASPSL